MLTAAFFSALNDVPEPQRAAVAKAALAGIRDELKMQREKIRAAVAKAKARAPVAVRAVAPQTRPRPTAAKTARKPRTASHSAA